MFIESLHLDPDLDLEEFDEMGTLGKIKHAI